MSNQQAADVEFGAAIGQIVKHYLRGDKMGYEVIELSDLQVDTTYTAGMQWAVYQVTLSALDGHEIKTLMCLCPTADAAQTIINALRAVTR